MVSFLPILEIDEAGDQLVLHFGIIFRGDVGPRDIFGHLNREGIHVLACT